MAALKIFALSAALNFLIAAPALAAAAKKKESPLMHYAIPVLGGIILFIIIVKVGKKVERRMRKGTQGPNMSVRNSDQRLRRQVEEEQMAQAAPSSGPIGATPPRAKSPVEATAAPQIAAGWHPDPSGQAQLRWWDGERWTDKTHNKEKQMKEGWYRDPSSPSQLRWWDGEKWSENVRPNPTSS